MCRLEMKESRCRQEKKAHQQNKLVPIAQRQVNIYNKNAINTIHAAPLCQIQIVYALYGIAGTDQIANKSTHCVLCR